MKPFLFALSLLLTPFATATAAQGALDGPADGAVVSGVGLFYGWVCEAEQVTLVIDDRPAKVAAYGTERGDTANKCGDTDNGFSLLWSYNLFGAGEHTVTAYADGEPFDSATFTVVPLDDGYLKDDTVPERIDVTLTHLDQTVTLAWNASAQNFSIVAVRPLVPALSTIYTFAEGTWQGQWMDTAGNKGGAIEITLAAEESKDGPPQLVVSRVEIENLSETAGVECANVSTDADPFDINEMSTRARMTDGGVVNLKVTVTSTLQAMAGDFHFEAGPCANLDGVFTLFRK